MKFALLVALSLLIMNGNAVLAQTSRNTSTGGCPSKIPEAEKSIESTINESKAISLAENSISYKNYTKAYNPSFDYIYYNWDVVGCNVALKSINVLFDFLFKSIPPCGGKQIVFVEDSNLNSVMNTVDAGTQFSPYCPLMLSNSNHNNTLIGISNKTNSTPCNMP